MRERGGWRCTKRIAFETACLCAAAGAAALLLAIIGATVWNGFDALSFEFLTTPSTGRGGQGGVLHQILGTVWMTAWAALIVAPLALACALVLELFANRRSTRLLRILLNALNAVPSILFGIFGYYFFVRFFGWGKSWLAGSILLAMMIAPTVTVSLADAMRAISATYLETARGLGLSSGRVALAVVIPQSLHGLWRGLLLGLARAAGETAPILFTAVTLTGVYALPHGIVDNPVLALPYHIFALSQDAYDPAAASAAWGAATVLFALVLAFFAASLPLRLRAHEEAGR